MSIVFHWVMLIQINILRTSKMNNTIKLVYSETCDLKPLTGDMWSLIRGMK